MSTAVPESTEPGRGRKWGLKRIGISVAGLVIVGSVGTYLGYRFELLTAFGRAQAEDKAGDAIEAAKDPFAWRMNPDLPTSEPWESWEIDRKLTSAEELELRSIDGEDKSAIWKFVQRLGGRRVRGYAATYDLQLTSEREQNVLITEVSAKATDCWDPKVKTRISVATGGTESWEEVFFEINPDNSVVPAMTWKRAPDVPEYETPEGVPFKEAISLSKTQTPGLLSVTPYKCLRTRASPRTHRERSSLSTDFELAGLTIGRSAVAGRRHLLARGERDTAGAGYGVTGR
ncbi:hypothetical protein [Streptomyces sp. XD-27]|uniref:hypothetical protein n=1 Tax=Streptomyces sp. XD-27 TaxID=3062779 RepID=UPI0026F41031|nr:hypothetical protein [Streptomyces sp. XD-27]WKX68614.1 hypothetical protein Q3Y56_00395 [Streptomyces sp. XD-27]